MARSAHPVHWVQPGTFRPAGQAADAAAAGAVRGGNYNLIELGPRETGKTYTFRNTSNRSFVVSGGKATPATLFYNKASRKLGVVGLKHVVFFDEIANTRFDDAEASISVLKDYMQTGKFSRATRSFRRRAPSCSAATSTRTSNSDSRRQRYKHLFQAACLPELQDPLSLTASTPICPAGRCPRFDRRITPPATACSPITWRRFSPNLRRRNFQTHVNAWVDFGKMTGHNQDAIKKTTAGLLKLLHPAPHSRNGAGKEISAPVEMAVEMRKRVTDQLAVILPMEFSMWNALSCRPPLAGAT